MKKIKIYCVTNKKIDFITKNNIHFAWVGKNEGPDSYLTCNTKENIYHKEKYYSELTFHYWFWKNLLDEENDNSWIGFCQKRRYWIQESYEKKIDKFNLDQYLLSEIDETKDIEALICKYKYQWCKKDKVIEKRMEKFIKKTFNIYE